VSAHDGPPWPEILCRVAPEVDELTRFFWQGGSDGVLRFHACGDCGQYHHPPAPVCPYCLGRSVEPKPVGGRATVYASTVNVQPWVEGQEPFVIAVVTIEEDERIRLTTNILRCEPSQVYIGMQVEVEFVEWEEFFLPCFRPVGAIA
jgi:uncharacterized OB-fold protein